MLTPQEKDTCVQALLLLSREGMIGKEQSDWFRETLYSIQHSGEGLLDRITEAFFGHDISEYEQEDDDCFKPITEDSNEHKTITG